MPLSKNRYSVRECILRLCEAIGLTKSTTVSDTSPQIHVSRMQSKKNTVNIPRDQDDPFWRYRRPELKIEVQGKNQSTVTVLTNLSHVCQGLQTDPRCTLLLSTSFLNFQGCISIVVWFSAPGMLLPRALIQKSSR